MRRSQRLQHRRCVLDLEYAGRYECGMPGGRTGRRLRGVRPHGQYLQLQAPRTLARYLPLRLPLIRRAWDSGTETALRADPGPDQSRSRVHSGAEAQHTRGRRRHDRSCGPCRARRFTRDSANSQKTTAAQPNWMPAAVMICTVTSRLLLRGTIGAEHWPVWRSTLRMRSRPA